MWLLVIFFMPIAILLVILDEHIKKQESKKQQEEISKTIKNLENEYNEINDLVQNLELEENKSRGNEGKDAENVYDDTVSNEEIEQFMNSIKDDELSSNEVIFLKFMNNKATDISFSPRWEFEYDLKPRLEIAKLLKLEYLTYSSWYDNVKNATAKELKEILKTEKLKVTGNKQELVERVLGNVDADFLEEKFNKGKYILTDKGNKIIEKNKRLFMSYREKAGEEFAEVTNAEYSQLQVFHKVNEYKRLKHNELSFEKGYKKNDILWSIYNRQTLEYLNKKDYVMASIVYYNMYNLLYSEKRYEKALNFLVCCLYMREYEILQDDEGIYNTDWYGIHLKKYMKELRDILQKNDMNIEIFDNRYKFITEYIKVPIQMYLPHWYEFEKVNKFQQKINELLDT